VLVVAMITTPAATAQLLVKRFTAMIQVAAIIGVSSAVVGLYVSYSLDIASGAAIVILETLLFLLALAFTSMRSRLYAARGAAKI
jgi:iron/zinc/copper transport system permease protein